MEKADIGIYGLGVMGRNIALNFSDQGFEVSVFNRSLPGEETVVDDFISGEASGTDIQGFHQVSEFVQSLKQPRKILLMVKAGAPVDSVIKQLKPQLEEGDILIDGGNSNYTDTNQRCHRLSEHGIRYVGMGVSGGEEGARNGPSLMPGGNKQAWPELKPLLQRVAAKASDGSPCCEWMGPNGAGHFVKMVHNGIEYAIMQLIAESYQLMKEGLKMGNPEMSTAFESWSSGLQESYLFDITADILSTRDPENENRFIIDLILDKAGQKGTGRWTALTALELGIPAPLITASVYARNISSFKKLREQASNHFSDTYSKAQPQSPDKLLGHLPNALLGGTLVAFAEGFWLMRAAKQEYNWSIPLADVARVWRSGCIIRSALLDPIAETCQTESGLPHLLMAPDFKNALVSAQEGWRTVLQSGIESGLPLPAMNAALAHFDALRTGRLPANLLQAQRDYFGAHQYERTDKPSGQLFHTPWNKD